MSRSQLPLILAAIFAWLAHPSPSAPRAPSLGRPVGGDGRETSSATSLGKLSIALAAAVLMVVWWSRSIALVAALPAGGLVVIAGRFFVGRWRLRTARARRRSEVIELCDALVAELQAGLPAVQVVTNACQSVPELAPVVATARLGGDLPAALRSAARRPGAEGLRLVAASWEVSGRSGAGLAAVLDRVSIALREDEEAHAEVAAALGSPRATAKLLAGLPLIGIGLGTAMGAEPLRFLLATPAGNGCLVVGVVLAVIGLWWVERLADAVEN